MHKILAIILTFLLVFCLSACRPGNTHAAEGYKYYPAEDGENPYILLSNELYPGPNLGMSFAPPHIQFSSVEEMINDIRTGTFTEDELRKLAYMRFGGTGKIPLMYMNDLYDIVAPEDFALQKIEWHAWSMYDIILECITGESIRISRFETELELEQVWLDCEKFDPESVISKTYNMEQSETVIVGYRDSEIIIKKTYSKEINGVVYNMYEEYVRTEEGEDLLRCIVAYVYQDDQYYYSIAIGSPQQHYGADFFAQFKLIPYIPEHSL
jgi:hypothetical protein